MEETLADFFRDWQGASFSVAFCAFRWLKSVCPVDGSLCHADGSCPLSCRRVPSVVPMGLLSVWCRALCVVPMVRARCVVPISVPSVPCRWGRAMCLVSIPLCVCYI